MIDLKCTILRRTNTTGKPFPLFTTEKGWFGYCETQYYPKEVSQHLYLLSDREVENGDWYWCPYYGHIYKCDERGMLATEGSKRIEATTDEDMGLALIPEEFVKEYAGVLGKISHVWIERSKIHDDWQTFKIYICCTIKNGKRWINLVRQPYHHYLKNDLEEIMKQAFDAGYESKIGNIHPNFGSPYIEYESEITFDMWWDGFKEKNKL